MKTVKLVMEIDYNSIRQAVCTINGELWDDDKIETMIGTGEVQMDSSVLGDRGDEMKLYMAVMSIVSKVKDEDLKSKPKKTSKFQERLDQMQEAKRKSNGNEIR